MAEGGGEGEIAFNCHLQLIFMRAKCASKTAAFTRGQAKPGLVMAHVLTRDTYLMLKVYGSFKVKALTLPVSAMKMAFGYSKIIVKCQCPNPLVRQVRLVALSDSKAIKARVRLMM